MELQLIDKHFDQKIQNLIEKNSLKEFSEKLFDLSSKAKFPNNEIGRKEARSLSRKIGTLKSRITEKFDEAIKAEKEKNKDILNAIDNLTKAKAKYLNECVEAQKTIKKDVEVFDEHIKSIMDKMQSYAVPYQSLSDLKDAKQKLFDLLEEDFQEKHKEVTKKFTQVIDILTCQETSLEALEKEQNNKHLEQPQENEVSNTPNIPQEQDKTLNNNSVEIVEKKAIYTLVFDTETTSIIPTKARIVQIAGIVFDENYKQVDSLNVLVKQDQPIPPNTIEIHGKNDKMCEEMGIPLIEALAQFNELVKNSDIVVAHNKSYDFQVIQCEFERANAHLNLSQKKTFDTMSIYKNIVKCPPTEKMINANMKGYKAPQLTEAYNFVFGKEFDNAHDALSDVLACADLYFHFIKVNKAVVETIKNTGISHDHARVIAKRLIAQDLTNFKG